MPIKPVLNKPEISAEWVAANKMEPDLKTFYDKNRFEKQIYRTDDFALTRERNPGVPSFDTYMTHFSMMNM